MDPDGKVRNTSHTPYGCFIDNPGLFDPLFFNMSPREAAQTCPMQRLALVTAYEALEMSGYVPNRTPSSALDRVGTFYGQTSDDYREMNAAQAVDTYFITGGIRAFGPVSASMSVDLPSKPRYYCALSSILWTANVFLGAHQLPLQVQRPQLQCRHRVLI